MRAVLGVIVGYAVWTAVWLGGNAGLRAAFPDDFGPEPPWTAPVPLACALVLSVVCSAAGAWVAARVAGARAAGAALALGVALLATGVAVQASVWGDMPLWYHVAFLALLVPVCLVVGRPRRSAA